MRPLSLLISLAVATVGLAGCVAPAATIAADGFEEQQRVVSEVQAKSDLRQLSVGQEIHFTGTGRYTDELADIEQLDIVVSDDVDVAMCTYDDGAGYVVAASHRSSDVTWATDKAAGTIIELDATVELGCDPHAATQTGTQAL